MHASPAAGMLRSQARSVLRAEALELSMADCKTALRWKHSVAAPEAASLMKFCRLACQQVGSRGLAS